MISIIFEIYVIKEKNAGIYICYSKSISTYFSEVGSIIKKIWKLIFKNYTSVQKFILKSILKT